MQYVNVDHLKFLLHEVLDAAQLQTLERFAETDQEMMDMTLDAAKQLGDQSFFPHYREMDKDKAYYKDGKVRVLSCVPAGVRAMGEAGYIGGTFDYEDNGMQLPFTLMSATQMILFAANSNIAAYGLLTSGAANLIRSFGSDELKATYLPKMMSGQWQGTMALTEPQAGSSLSDITTYYEERADGTYTIKGQKIYISGGDYEGADNVVHLLLARKKDGPAGTKGVGLFVVPKYRPENGELVDNHVTTAGIYGKMGQKGYVAAHLMYGEQGETIGYLVGEEFKGLKHMFLMMNEARIGTGLMAAGTASAAYYASLQYAKERPQGRHPDNKDVNAEQVLIIEHADVRRMLLFQKAVVEGSAALLLQCSLYADLAEFHPDETTRQNNHLLLELLTPIAKSYPSEYGNESVSLGMQVLGGAGYCDDFPLEQHFRDIRVNSIYEGTTTIHGMDLLGRKLVMHNGKAVQLLTQEITKTIEAAMATPRLQAHAQTLAKSLGGVQQVTQHLMGVAQNGGPRAFLADATIFLDYFALHVLGWLWLKQSLAAQAGLDGKGNFGAEFYESRLLTADYFFTYELPRASGHKRILMNTEGVTLRAEAELLI